MAEAASSTFRNSNDIVVIAYGVVCAAVLLANGAAISAFLAVVWINILVLCRPHHYRLSAKTADNRINDSRGASACLTAAGFLIPGGFFLGGFFAYDGDPGLSILIVPVGAVLLLTALFLTAKG